MTPFTPNRSRSLLPWLLLGGLGTQILTLILVTGQGMAIRRLNDKPPPSLVQMQDGSAYRVRPVAASNRTPAVIQYFTTTTLTQLFNWNGELVEADGQRIKDPGIDIETDEGTAKVTTASMTASFALSEAFRLPFLQRVAALTPPGVFTGNTQVVLIIDRVSEPQELAPGKWQLSVLAHLAVFTGGSSPQTTIPFHREITVEATTAPVVPEGETPLEQAIYSIRQAGLVITDIRPLER
jgi:hypothetical protein